MVTNYHYVANLADQISESQPESIISRTFYTDEQLKVILFSFAPGQELSEHTASVPAIIHIIEGEAQLTLGKDAFDAQSGTWAHMPANLPHSLFAKTPTKMLLIMLKAQS
ncbi:MAG TPA: cupin domain-containing protein [Anaerolineales bacterium]|nr:cupin domain-containing protein [Anaerolineales bacterium]